MTATALGGCAEKAPPVPDALIRMVDAGLPDVPVSMVDAGMADIEAEIAAATGAPPGKIFDLGNHAEALRVNQIMQISFTLPSELKALFDKVKFWGIIGPRVDSEGRSPFELMDFILDRETGVLKAGVKPLPGAFVENEPNLWKFIAEVGEGAETNYCAYGLPVADEGREIPDAGTRRDTGRRREDAGTRTPDVSPPLPDISATAEARVRIRP
ncbi:hypothetical protein HZC35_03555 [Candidatus Saganbacteria bacterium]|nr:hypothetical protein [Candidatus Saganbacteria bacterium]